MDKTTDQIVAADWDAKLQEVLGMSAAQLYQGIMRLLTRQRSPSRDDLAQDIFLSVLLHLDQYRGDGPAAAWIAAIARQHVRRWAAHHKRRVVELGDWREHDPRTSPEQQLQERQFMSMVHSALSQHSTTTRQALLLTELEGCSCQEAAEVLGLDAQRVKNRKSDARKQLRADPTLLEALPSHWGGFARLGVASLGIFCLGALGMSLWSGSPSKPAPGVAPSSPPSGVSQGASRSSAMISSPTAPSALGSDATLEERKQRAVQLLFSGQDLRESIRLCTQVLAQGGSQDCHRILGIAYSKSGDQAKACHHLREAQLAIPPNPELIMSYMKKLGCGGEP